MPSTSITSDAPFTFLGGGYARCDHTWGKPATALDRCYKLYFLTEGSGQIETQTEKVRLRANYGYFIPGFQLIEQACPKRMNVHWIHFTPPSLYLAYQLSNISSVHRWKLNELSQWEPIYTDIGCMLEQPPHWYQCRLQAMLLDLVGRVMQFYEFKHMAAVDAVFEQLQPAITYMEDNLLANPKLEEIARIVHLAPNYFHRKFKSIFFITPLAYMLRRRLDIARQLLLSTDMTVKQIAHRSGFESPFYLSRIFKREFGISPSDYRKKTGP